MSLPDPKPGLILQYGYLWRREQATGQIEGSKNRPAVVVFVDKDEDADTLVVVLPITHGVPDAGTTARAIPPEVAKAANLDWDQSWVVLDEYNEFVWPGFDLALVPGSDPPSHAHGFLSRGFFSSLVAEWLDLDEQRKSHRIPREE